MTQERIRQTSRGPMDFGLYATVDHIKAKLAGKRLLYRKFQCNVETLKIGFSLSKVSQQKLRYNLEFHIPRCRIRARKKKARRSISCKLLR